MADESEARDALDYLQRLVRARHEHPTGNRPIQDAWRRGPEVERERDRDRALRPAARQVAQKLEDVVRKGRKPGAAARLLDRRLTRLTGIYQHRDYFLDPDRRNELVNLMAGPDGTGTFNEATFKRNKELAVLVRDFDTAWSTWHRENARSASEPEREASEPQSEHQSEPQTEHWPDSRPEPQTTAQARDEEDPYGTDAFFADINESDLAGLEAGIESGIASRSVRPDQRETAMPRTTSGNNAAPSFSDDDAFAGMSEAELVRLERDALRAVEARQVGTRILEARLRARDAELNTLMDGIVPPGPAHARQRSAAFALLARSDPAVGEGGERPTASTEAVLSDIHQERPRAYLKPDWEYVEELADLLQRYGNTCAGRRADLPPLARLGAHTDTYHLGENGALRATPEGWDDASRLREEVRNKLNEVVPDGAHFDAARQSLIDAVHARSWEERGRAGLRETMRAVRQAVRQADPERTAPQPPPSGQDREVASGIARAIAQGMRDRADMLARGRAQGFARPVPSAERPADAALADRLPAGTLAAPDPAERARIREQPISLDRDTSLVEALWSEGPPRAHPLLDIPDGCVPLAEPVSDSEPDPIPEPPGGFRHAQEPGSSLASNASASRESSPFQNAQPRSPLPDLSDWELPSSPSLPSQHFGSHSRWPYDDQMAGLAQSPPRPAPGRHPDGPGAAASQGARAAGGPGSSQSARRHSGSARPGSSQESPGQSNSVQSNSGQSNSGQAGSALPSPASPSQRHALSSHDDSSFQPAQRRDWPVPFSDSQSAAALSPASMLASSPERPKNLRERSRSQEDSLQTGGQVLGKRTRDAGDATSPGTSEASRPTRRPRLDDRSDGHGL